MTQEEIINLQDFVEDNLSNNDFCSVTIQPIKLEGSQSAQIFIDGDSVIQYTYETAQAFLDGFLTGLQLLTIKSK